ncbi:RNA polymerase recycling motor HelD [Bacillus sp. Marseille-P3661]|uniref:RNA polymerase recycling motor HelD n=1 Tax=Bacillus sp. Marseille-P3661 TaxID=1936234 RepID=UPI000C831710|nr:RNA polymerase recycling motor HelD [Bacillus sp. Marseille-P3661]
MHNEWKEEQLRVEKILYIIKKKQELIDRNSKGVKADIKGIRKTFWDDVTLNFEDSGEVGETFTSIKQQVEMLSERERSHKKMDQQLRNLSRLKNSPYFGRIDFIESGDQKEEKIYIGTSSLMDEEDKEFLIYDWRAPISSVYYDYSTGPAQYDTLDGLIEGEITLKRQYIIKNGKLKAMFDTGVTIGDEVLQEVLSNNANTQMKSIVSTIQKEQNDIIRNERSKLLFVQGVAGSGKTSAALQRIAYLLYRYRESIQSENIMLFSPNPMFSNYVATVLPELGEENMQQETFQHYLELRLGRKYEIEDSFSQIEFVLTSSNKQEVQARLEGIRYKGSQDFIDLIQNYVRNLSKQGLIFRNIIFRGEILISKQVIQEKFYSLDCTMSIPNRLEIVKDWLLKELRRMSKQESKKDWVLEEIELMDNDEYQKIYKRLQKQGRFSENTFNDFEREQKALAKTLVNHYFKPIRSAVKKLKFLNLEEIYCQIFKEPIIKKPIPINWDDICNQTLQNINKQRLFYEDATPFLFLQDQLEGRKPNTQIRHLFIDEAQDYTPFQFAFLKQLYPSSRMTILGDFNQAIFSETMKAFSIFSKDLMTLREDSEIITLTKSYRSTKEIVEFTKELLDEGNVIEPINRSGNQPFVIQSDDQELLHKEMLKLIANLQSKGHETIAIICKTAQESREVFKEINQDIPARLIDKGTSTYEKGVSVLPVYLAKGIEFDAVIIHDCSAGVYTHDNEKKLLYTACTRAMHELYLFSSGEKSPLINKISKGLYETIII